MISNPKICWEYEIQTDNLREPDASFQLLQYTILHPEKSLKECSEDMGVEYNTAKKWSMKYFYKERRKAYNHDMATALQTGIQQHKQKQITEAKKRQSSEENAINDELYFLNKDKKTRATLEKNNEQIPDHLNQSITEKEKKYWNNRYNKFKADKLLYDIPITPTPLEEIEDSLIQDKPGIKMFMDAMKGNRDAHHKE